MKITLGLIVEGHGDVQAAPVLVRRIIQEIDPQIHLRIPLPIRIPKNRMVRPGELERAVDFAARQLSDHGGVLVLLDADEDCPALLGPDLLERAKGSRPDKPVGLVIAKTEFESWFLAAAESLRGQRGLAQDLTSPSDPEGIRGAKEWLTRRMTTGRKYRETVDQIALARRLDLAAAARAPSFRKLRRDVKRLVHRICGSELH